MVLALSLTPQQMADLAEEEVPAGMAAAVGLVPAAAIQAGAAATTYLDHMQAEAAAILLTD